MRALALASLILAVACSGRYSGDDDEACLKLAAAQCDKLATCEHDGVANEYGDEPACESRLRDACKAQFEASHSGARASAVETCADALHDATCSDFEAGIVDECQPQPGTLADGQPCALSPQCSSGFCALLVNGACGTCAALTAAGDDCSTTICAPGFSCTPSKTCTPYGAAGADCNADEPCASALTCVTAAGATNGTCVDDAAQAGAPCDPAHAAAPDCDALSGFSCDPATHTCTALTYANAGQPCGDVAGTTVACSRQSSCVNGTCVAYADDGHACDVMAGPSCAPPAVCVTSGSGVTQGTCALLDATQCK